jgi:glycerate 2-kinase
MRVVIAPDKFKGSLSASEAAEAMARGVARAAPGATIDRVPMADGGEGTVAALVAATGGSFRDATVHGPMGEPISARFGLLGDGRTAAIEMASASGLVLVPIDLRDPMIATTRGTGELLLAAIAAGANRVIVGIGGSATNDGGAGLGQALGYRLLDDQGCELGPGGGSLARLARIDASGRRPELDGIEVAVACDVTNPLCGPRGASAVYGPQKGATPAMVEELDANLAHFAAIVERDLGVSIRDVPGSGAAGGLGGGLVAFAGGRLEPGINLVIEAVDLKGRLEGADLCLTGEGALDDQSAFGKTAVGVGRLARSLGCPVLALAGSIGPGAEATLEAGLDAYFSICPGPITLDQAMARAGELLEEATTQAVRAFLAGRGEKSASGLFPPEGGWPNPPMGATL